MAPFSSSRDRDIALRITLHAEPAASQGNGEDADDFHVGLYAPAEPQAVVAEPVAANDRGTQSSMHAVQPALLPQANEPPDRAAPEASSPTARAPSNVQRDRAAHLAPASVERGARQLRDIELERPDDATRRATPSVGRPVASAATTQRGARETASAGESVSASPPPARSEGATKQGQREVVTLEPVAPQDVAREAVEQASAAHGAGTSASQWGRASQQVREHPYHETAADKGKHLTLTHKGATVAEKVAIRAFHGKLPVLLRIAERFKGPLLSQRADSPHGGIVHLGLPATGFEDALPLHASKDFLCYLRNFYMVYIIPLHDRLCPNFQSELERRHMEKSKLPKELREAASVMPPVWSRISLHQRDDVSVAPRLRRKAPSIVLNCKSESLVVQYFKRAEAHPSRIVLQQGELLFYGGQHCRIHLQALRPSQSDISAIIFSYPDLQLLRIPENIA